MIWVSHELNYVHITFFKCSLCYFQILVAVYLFIVIDFIMKPLYSFLYRFIYLPGLPPGFFSIEPIGTWET